MKKKLIRVTTIPLSLNLLLRNQLKFLNNHFDVIALSSPGKDLTEVAEREGVKVLTVPMKRQINVLKDLSALVSLIRVLLSERPFIVHANTPKGSLLSIIAARIARVPKRIYTITGLRYETERGFKRFILIAMERLTCYFATHVVAESLGVKRMIIEDRLSQKEVTIIGNGNINGVDVAYWNPDIYTSERKSDLAKTLNITKDCFIYTFVGRLVRDKGINELVEVFSSLNIPNIVLILIGEFENKDSDLDKVVLNLIEKSSNIKLVGFQQDIRPFLAITNILVLPSYREGFPNVILQAGAMRIPVIATRVNGVEDVIDGKNGILVDKQNPNKLKIAMEDLYHNYKSYDKDYCREKILKKYDQSVYYPLLLDYYGRL